MDKFGNLFFIGFQNNFNQNIIEKINPCGVILYPENMKDIYTLQINIERIYSLFEKGYSFFISSDHEGGQLETVPNIFPSPGNMALGKTNHSYNYGKYLGNMLKLHGFNMVFAPVIDVKYNVSSHVTGFRTFSDKHEIVEKSAKEFIKGLLENNIAPTLKHFPGHGKARSDSHYTLPIVENFEKYDKDMMLFKNLSPNVDFIMTAHVLYPKIDNENIATLSKKLITDILKKEFEYKGLVISDAFEMKALYKNHTPKEVIKKFFEAGGDVILIGDFENYSYFYDTFISMVKTEELDKELLNEKIKKIEKIKEKYVEKTYPTKFLSHAAKEAITFNVKLPIENPVFLIPFPKNLSLADTSKNDLKHLRKLILDEFPNAKIYKESNNISSEDTVVYFVLDKVERLNAKRVIYVFLRNKIKNINEYISLNSSKLISIYHALKLLKGEGLL
ncbi:glycoside hydrolase family 3 [Thermosipho affectus]|uniref:beta-N-acetylhexosaminidase n=1 Tax=Thermosipho affectus TaxID=660294 RepID=A0ABX3IH22_9BACT|nr:glycoside hydrolase family 3 N-terminal domain-containing protein [Thermosipho affectus]ONN27120.1 glycoside hydrolase family 3 [Thermosipho affectus]